MKNPFDQILNYSNEEETKPKKVIDINALIKKIQEIS